MDAEMGLGEMLKADLSMPWALQEIAFIYQDYGLNW